MSDQNKQPTPDQLRAIAACLEIIGPFDMGNRVEILGALTNYSGVKAHVMKDVTDDIQAFLSDVKKAHQESLSKTKEAATEAEPPS